MLYHELPNNVRFTKLENFKEREYSCGCQILTIVLEYYTKSAVKHCTEKSI